ncbi:MAG: hypothetical protein ACLP1E_00335 [Acidimicrobiales bacterium]
MTDFTIAHEEAEMDKERVLDLLGAPFQGKYAAGAAEWLKNAYDQAVRMDEPGVPYIVLNVEVPTSRSGADGRMECIDFVGATYEEIDEHLKRWGSDVAASRGRDDFAGFGGHGNGGKFHMRENFKQSEFITYREGRITVFGFDDSKRYGFDERYRGAHVSPDEAREIAGLDPERADIPDPVRSSLQSNDPSKCRFTIVRGRGLRHPSQWSRTEAFDAKLLADPQAKQVVERAHVIFCDGNRVVDPLSVPAIPDRPGYEAGRTYDLPAELSSGEDAFVLTTDPAAGQMVLRVAFDPFARRDPTHAVDVRGRNGLIIASYRVSELPIRNRAGADFIYGVLDAPVFEEHGLKTNDRVHLVANSLADAVLEWIAARIDDLSDELAKEENAKRRARDENENQALTSRLNRWKNKFLRAREVMVSIGKGEGPGAGGTGGGGSGGKGAFHSEEGGTGGGGGGGGAGAGGSGTQEGGGGAGDKKMSVPRFPEIRISGYDPDPDTGEVFILHPRQPVVYQRTHDVAANLWWINAQRPLADRILQDDGAKSARWRDYVFGRFVEVIQAYDVRANWDGTTDISEYLWELLGVIQDSAAVDLSDVLFTTDPD